MRTCPVEIQPQAQLPRSFRGSLAPADQGRMGQALIHHRLHRAQHAFFLAFGIDDAARRWRAISKTGRISWPER